MTDAAPDDAALGRRAEKLGEALRARGLRLATAESCTGGWIAKLVTDIAGSSDWFEAGAVTYSDRAKTESLSVPQELLRAQGAVSEPVVLAMVQGVRRRYHSDAAVAVSGIAGPGGDTEDKPVGLVCFAWAVGAATSSASRRFAGDRDEVRRHAVAFALDGLIALIEGKN